MDTWKHTESIIGYSSTSSYDSYEFWSDYTADESYTANRIGIYSWADSGNNVTVIIAIYDDDSGSPGNLLAYTSGITVNSSGWLDGDLNTNVTITNGTKYHFAHITNAAPNTQWRYRDESPTTGSPYRDSVSYPTLYDPAEASGPSSRRYAAYRIGYGTVSNDPTISNFGDEQHYPGETGIKITGTNYGASQGDGSAYLGDGTSYLCSSNFTNLNITDWSDSSIICGIPTNLGDNEEGTLYLYVSNNDGTNNTTGYECDIKSAWGLRTVQGSNSGCNYWRMMGGTSPNIDNMKLKKLVSYVGPTHGAQVRMAVYIGGDLDDPTGAELLEDFGQTTGSDTETWLELESSNEPEIPKNTPTWIAWKGNTDSGTFDINYSGTDPVPCDFQQTRGRCQINSNGQNPATVYDQTISGYDSFNNYWYSAYLTWEILAQSDKTCTFHCSGPGSITGDASQVVAYGGDTTTITACADSTCVFNGWTGDYTGLTNPLQITNVTSNMDMTANFGLWSINNCNYMYRSDHTSCLFCGADCTDYNPVYCDCSSQPYSLLAGVREGMYGLASNEASHEDWTNAIWGMHWRCGRADKVGLFNISHIFGNDCRFGFADPGGVSDENITFTGTDIHSTLFSQFDTDGDIDIYLALELGEADATEAIQVALDKYGSHNCVKGILIDLEWWDVNGSGNYSTQLPAATAEGWLRVIQEYDSNYKLILRHPDPDILPDNPFSSDIWVNCDDQGFIGLGDSTTTGDWQIPMFKAFADSFPDHTCFFQIGYNDIWEGGGESRNDKDWWGGYDNPPTTICNAIIDYVVADRTNQAFGIVWADFSLEDEEVDLLDTPDSTHLWANCPLHNFAIAGGALNIPANAPVCSLCDTSGKAAW